ncbi:helix-turn-helix domain-containing protein [Streptosporangium sp. NPDC002721]|uniref:helix-turn-helix domain-containing protein n=1 Tax=Streptosporangium sp. NPDC002721 TaxID=3366188 RepID=UPI003673C644
MAGQATIGDRIRGLRLSRHMSQAQLAGPDLSDSYVSLIESGKRTPTPVVTRLLADRLGCGMEFLLHGIEPHQRVDTVLALRQAELELCHGDPAAAAGLFEATARAAGEENASLAAQARFGQARALEVQGHTERAVEAYELLRREAAARPERLADLPLVVALCRCYHRAGDTLRARDLGAEALAQADRLGLDRGDLALDLAAVLAEVETDLAYVERVLAAAPLPEAVDRDAEVLGLWRASTAATEKDPALAARLAADAVAAGRPARMAVRYARSAMRWAWTATVRPEDAGLDRAGGFAASAAEILSRLSPGTIEHARSLVVLSRVRSRSGDADAAAELVEQAVGLLAGVRGTVPAMAYVVSAELALARSKDGGPALEKAQELLADPVARAAPAASFVDRESARLWREIGDLWGRAGSPERQTNAYRSALEAVGISSRAEPPAGSTLPEVAVPAVLAVPAHLDVSHESRAG